MPLEFFAGQRLTADALQRVVPDRVVQGTDQTVSSSTTLVDSNIVIEVDDLIKVDLEINYGTAASGGGIRWDWTDSGAVTLLARSIGTYGPSATGGPSAASDMNWRFWNQIDTDITVVQMGTAATNRISETLVLQGSGTLTLRFAQQVSAAPLTTLLAETYAVITRLGS